MGWINVKEGLPKQSCLCLVRNEKGWMNHVMALYDPGYEVFVLYDPNYREKLLLDVTHYLEIETYE